MVKRTAGTDRYDVVVIGGGAAGLNAALMLARSRRRVVVIDAGRPRNAPAHAVHGLLGHDGTPPAELLARGATEIAGYGGELREGEVREVERVTDGFAVLLADGGRLEARRLLVTTGLVDRLPEVEGVAERWGSDVLHCPYCHGWEVRDQAIGVLGSGPMSAHQAMLFRQLSADVVYFQHTAPALTDQQTAEFAARGIRVVEGKVSGLVVDDDRLTGVRLVDGAEVPRQALVVATRMEARASFLGSLGLEPVEHPSGMGVHIPVDATGRTAVDGVWAAGNVTDLSAQVGAAAAAGAMAAAQINYDLVLADVQASLVAG